MNNNEIYRKRECELCGFFTFEKHLGTAAVLDGGFTRIENFEKSGFGSLVIVPHDLEFSRIELHLCPDCAKKFEAVIDKTIKELTVDGEQDG